MTFLELAKTRQSVRSYTNEAVAKEDIMTCLEAARLAPSACNSQPWTFVVVDAPEKLATLQDAINPLGAPMNKFAREVPVLVVVVEEEAQLMKGAEAKKERWVDQDYGSAVSHFCLQAAELGLGTCIMGSFDEAAVKAAVGIPTERTVKVVLALGHPDSDTIRPKLRKTIGEISRFNQYQ